MPQTYAIPYVGHSGCAEDVQSFRFERPKDYAFRPGQFFQLTLQTREGEQAKFFSHADAPADAVVELTTRLSGSAFKDALLALEVGARVGFRGPMGSLAVPPEASSVGFLTGGVGITPAHSIIRATQRQDSPLPMALFYGSRTPACIPYADEFRRYASEGRRFTYVEVVETPDADWDGPVGFLTADIIREHTHPNDVGHWIVSGPPAMVVAMRRLVDELQLPPGRVSYEQFAGYDPDEHPLGE